MFTRVEGGRGATAQTVNFVKVKNTSGDLISERETPIISSESRRVPIDSKKCKEF